jgi:hypothetical protein
VAARRSATDKRVAVAEFFSFSQGRRSHGVGWLLAEYAVVVAGCGKDRGEGDAVDEFQAVVDVR